MSRHSFRPLIKIRGCFKGYSISWVGINLFYAVPTNVEIVEILQRFLPLNTCGGFGHNYIRQVSAESKQVHKAFICVHVELFVIDLNKRSCEMIDLLSDRFISLHSVHITRTFQAF